MNAQVVARDSSPVSLGEWIITLIIFCIPLVNIVMLFVWGFSSGTNPSKQNFCRAYLILLLIGIVLWILFMVFFGAAMFSAAHHMGGASM